MINVSILTHCMPSRNYSSALCILINLNWITFEYPISVLILNFFNHLRGDKVNDEDVMV